MVKIRNTQKGLTILEYCAGAALVGLVAFAVVRSMGDGLIDAAGTIGRWASTQANNLNGGNNNGGGTTTTGSGNTTGSGEATAVDGETTMGGGESTENGE